MNCILRVKIRNGEEVRTYDHFFEWDTEKEYHDKLDQIEKAADLAGLHLLSITALEAN